jgi:isoleucyl-tRNA synthetase
MRWMFCRQNPADNLLFGYKKADEVRRQFYLMLWNVYRFFVEYANLDKFETGLAKAKIKPEVKNILDQWVLSRFTTTIFDVKKNLEGFNAKDSALELEKFVSDLSTWYIRRSRDRIWVNSEDKKDKKDFYSILYYILVNLSIALSPFMPFISEEIYKNLTRGKSVHLEFWPELNLKSKNHYPKLEQDMIFARQIVEAGQAKRKEEGKKVRIPLANLDLKVEGSSSRLLPDLVWDIVLKELNVKNLTINDNFHYPKKEIQVSEAELEKEGKLRELIRQIQSERKLKDLKPADKIILTIPKEFEKEKNWIAKRVIAKQIILSDKVIVQK